MTAYARQAHFNGANNGKTQLDPNDDAVKEMDNHAKSFGNFWKRNLSNNWNYMSDQQKRRSFGNFKPPQGQNGRTVFDHIAGGLTIFKYIPNNRISVTNRNATTNRNVTQYASEIEFGADLQDPFQPSEGFAHFHRWR